MRKGLESSPANPPRRKNPASVDLQKEKCGIGEKTPVFFFFLRLLLESLLDFSLLEDCLLCDI
jgi:hypothetical protein